MAEEVDWSTRLWTPAQVSERLGVTEQTLAHWRATGRVRLPYVSISRRCVRYRQEDVEKFINDKMIGEKQ